MLGSSYPGVAQFGSALEWGSRGREFDSRHSDQKTSSTELVFFCCIRRCGQRQTHSFLLQNWAKFVKIWVAADRSGHPCRVLGLVALTGAKPIFYFPTVLVGGVVPAMYFRQSMICASVMPLARSHSASPASPFVIKSFLKRRLRKISCSGSAAQ